MQQLMRQFNLLKNIHSVGLFGLDFDAMVRRQRAQFEAIIKFIVCNRMMGDGGTGNVKNNNGSEHNEDRRTQKITNNELKMRRHKI